jgi:hypothetical protein
MESDSIVSSPIAAKPVYQVIDPQDEILASKINLQAARQFANQAPNRFVVGPCTKCGHDALEEYPVGVSDPLLCWHCKE